MPHDSLKICNHVISMEGYRKRINGRTMNGGSCLNGVLKRTRNRAEQFTRNSRNCDIRVSLRFLSRRGRIWLSCSFQRSYARLSVWSEWQRIRFIHLQNNKLLSYILFNVPLFNIISLYYLNSYNYLNCYVIRKENGMIQF